MLKKPDAAAFYKELYAYSPTKVTLPALGSEDVKLPGTGIGSPKAQAFPPARPTPLLEKPLELVAPTTAGEKAKLDQPKAKPDVKTAAPGAKTDVSKAATPKLEQPHDVRPPGAGTSKEKAPR